jgi:hypothetical protein
LALTKFPAINASYGDNVIVRHGVVNMGIAVAIKAAGLKLKDRGWKLEIGEPPINFDRRLFLNQGGANQRHPIERLTCALMNHKIHKYLPWIMRQHWADV